VRATSSRGHRFHRGLAVRPISASMSPGPGHRGHRAHVGAVGRSPRGTRSGRWAELLLMPGQATFDRNKLLPSSSSMARTCHRGTMWRLPRATTSDRSNGRAARAATPGPQPVCHRSGAKVVSRSTSRPCSGCAGPPTVPVRCCWPPTTGPAGRPPFPEPGRGRRRTGLRRPPLRARATATSASRTATSMWTRRRRQSGKSRLGGGGQLRRGPMVLHLERNRAAFGPSAASSPPMALAGAGVPAARRGRTRCPPSAARRRPWRAFAEAAQPCRHPGRHAAQRRRR
jgi:hypothetical protein